METTSFVPLVTPAGANGELAEIVATMSDVITSGSYRVDGGYADAVGRVLAQHFALPETWEVLTFRSGTEALARALVALGVGPGDRVAVPDLAYHAVAGVVLGAGCTPVMIDVDEHDWNLAPEALSDAFERRSVDAVIAVDNYGTPCDHETLGRICRAAGVPLLLDACESLGSVSPQGSAARHVDACVVSFSFTKPVHAAGAGGALAINRESAARLRAAPAQMLRQAQLPELNAAFLIRTWSQLDANVARLRGQYERYRDAVVPFGFVAQRERSASSRLHAPFLLPPGRTPDDRDVLIRRLSDVGLEARAMFPSQTRLLGLGTPPPRSQMVDRRVLCFPTGAGLTEGGMTEGGTIGGGTLGGGIIERVVSAVDGW
jgi:dTDP-4-amino-4,6-dideoxygalactose transaminase